MSERLDELGGATVALVTFTRARNLKGYRARLGIGYAVLSDEERRAYRAYGLGRGPWWRIWTLESVRTYRRLMRSGARLQAPKEDTLQLGGDFIVDAEGRIAYAHPSRNPSDRPPVDELVAAVASLGRG